MLIPNVQIGNSNLQITQECCRKEEKKPAAPSINQKPFSRTQTKPPTFFLLLWSGLWLPEKYIAEGQRKKYSGIITANSYSFETRPMGNLVSS